MDIKTLLKKIEELEARCAEWEKKYSELEAKLAEKNKDSSNSSKPPSQDPLGTERKYPKKEKSGKKPGGQKGHQGKCKDFRQKPDIIQTHQPKSCLEC